ncbi:MAG: hypothetical protein K6F69_08985 [Treponema sp.]|nr:hypothetical protein [Treponema sp.]
MAIYGIGAYFSSDVSQDFITNSIVGTGWSKVDAPELFQYMQSLKVGDIIYIKSFSPSSPDIIIKGIGIIKDDILVANNIVTCGRNVIWKNTKTLRIQKPQEKNNVRSNTMYEEFHPDVQKFIIQNI